MSNFTSINGVSFPSPSTVRQPVLQSHSTYSQANLGSVTVCVSCQGIQFPSPSYTSPITTLSSVQTRYAQQRPIPNNGSNFWKQQSTTNEMNSYLSNGWQRNIPTTMPWISTTSDLNRVQFTATTSPSKMSLLDRISGSPGRRMKTLKRRAHVGDREACPDNKVFINEDRVAEGMRNLQLSAVANNNSSVAADRNQAWFSSQSAANASSSADEETGEMEEADVESGGQIVTAPTLHIAEELQGGLARKDVVQQLILDEITKRGKQLVLWKPPGDQIKQILSGVPIDPTQHARLSKAMDVIDMGCTAPGDKLKVGSCQKEPGMHLSSNRNSSFTMDIQSTDSMDSCQSSVTMDTRQSGSVQQNALPNMGGAHMMQPMEAYIPQPGIAQPNMGQPNMGQSIMGQPNMGQPNMGKPNIGRQNVAASMNINCALYGNNNNAGPLESNTLSQDFSFVNSGLNLGGNCVNTRPVFDLMDDDDLDL